MSACGFLMREKLDIRNARCEAKHNMEVFWMRHVHGRRKSASVPSPAKSSFHDRKSISAAMAASQLSFLKSTQVHIVDNEQGLFLHLVIDQV